MPRQASHYWRQSAEMLFSAAQTRQLPHAGFASEIILNGAAGVLAPDLTPIQRRVRAGIKNISRKVRANVQPIAVWHAYASRSDLTSGTELLVTGGQARVRIQVNDHVSVETPDGGRRLLTVADRRGASLVLADDEGGRRVLIASVLVILANFKLSEGFSREGWTVS